MTGWHTGAAAIDAVAAAKAEREAELAARKALPWYGGNKIPRWYLDKFSLGGTDDKPDDLPYDVAAFVRDHL